MKRTVPEVAVKQEACLCSGCLSTDRHLNAPRAHTDLFMYLLGQYAGLVSPDSVLLCWECSAVLRRLSRFQHQVQAAQATLMQTLDPRDESLQCLSTMVISEFDVIECVPTILNKHLGSPNTSRFPKNYPTKTEKYIIDHNHSTKIIKDQNQSEELELLFLQQNEDLTENIGFIKDIKTDIADLEVQNISKTDTLSTGKSLLKPITLAKNYQKDLNNAAGRFKLGSLENFTGNIDPCTDDNNDTADLATSNDSHTEPQLTIEIGDEEIPLTLPNRKQYVRRDKIPKKFDKDAETRKTETSILFVKEICPKIEPKKEYDEYDDHLAEINKESVFEDASNGTVGLQVNHIQTHTPLTTEVAIIDPMPLPTIATDLYKTLSIPSTCKTDTSEHDSHCSTKIGKEKDQTGDIPSDTWSVGCRESPTDIFNPIENIDDGTTEDNASESGHKSKQFNSKKRKEFSEYLDVRRNPAIDMSACSQWFTTSARGETERSAGGGGVYRCLICQEVTDAGGAGGAGARRHLELHQWLFACTACRLPGRPRPTFHSYRDFYYHCSSLHTKYVCDHCGAARQARATLSYHLRKRHPAWEAPEPRYCPGRGQELRTEAAHRDNTRHARTKHTESKNKKARAANKNNRDRSVIVALHEQGYKISEIARELKTTFRTVKRWITRNAEEGSLATRRRSGRPRSITEAQRRELVAQYERDGSIPTRAFAHKFKTSVGTVRRALRREGLRHTLPDLKPAPTAEVAPHTTRP